MPKSLREVLARKSPERRAKIEADAKRMIEEEKALRRRDVVARFKKKLAPYVKFPTEH